MRPDAPVVDAHAEQHRHRLVDRHPREPRVVSAPGRQRGDGQSRGGKPLPQRDQHLAIEPTLRQRGVEVDLDARDPGIRFHRDRVDQSALQRFGI